MSGVPGAVAPAASNEATLPPAAEFRVQRLARFYEVMPDADAARRRRRASAGDLDRRRLALSQRRDHGVPVEGSAGAEGAHHQPGADVFEAVSGGVGRAEGEGLLRDLFAVRDAHTKSRPPSLLQRPLPRGLALFPLWVMFATGLI